MKTPIIIINTSDGKKDLIKSIKDADCKNVFVNAIAKELICDTNIPPNMYKNIEL